jgi:hypothetical protein
MVSEILRQGWNCTALHLDINAPCYVRVLVVEGQAVSDLRAELAAALNVAMPGAGVETRVEAAPEAAVKAKGDDGAAIERCRHCGCEWRCPECDGMPVVRGDHADVVVLDELDPAVDWGGGSDEGAAVYGLGAMVPEGLAGYAPSDTDEEKLTAADLAKLEGELEAANPKPKDGLYRHAPGVVEQSAYAQLPSEFFDTASGALSAGLSSEEVAGALEHKGVLKPATEDDDAG